MPSLYYRLAVCLLAGGLFGWAMSTKIPQAFALGSGAAAAAFLFVLLSYGARLDRREDDRLIPGAGRRWKVK